MLLRTFYVQTFKVSRLSGIRKFATGSNSPVWKQWNEEEASPSSEKHEDNIDEIEAFGGINAYENEDALLEDDFNTEKDVERLINSLKKIDEGAPILGSGLVKDHVHKLNISEMESPDDTTSRPLNRWRKIIYDEGELDNSKLDLPPSRTNPHPFDEKWQKISLPPTHARSMAAYVNHSKVLQNLLDLGVDLLDIDTKTTLARHFVRMDWEKDAFPRLNWLVKSIGVDHEMLASYITRNPFFLIQNLDEMKERVSYLKSKKFTKAQIIKIVTENRYWLNMDIKTTDSRLGWIQRQFHLSGNEVRYLLTKEPRLIIFGLGPLQRLVLLLNNELRFTKEDIKKMLLEDPRLFMIDAKHIISSFNYLVLVMDIPNYLIVDYPCSLRCSVAAIRKRHDFLKRLNKAIYNPEVPGYVSLEKLLQPSDRKFAENVARVKLVDYNTFMKIL
uniref:Mitochondrial transcription termination factor n=1 Tax=Panagrolaimus sp. ES5 TaxID=591445 RepID=A0AC34FNA7_9BILA